MRKAVVVDTSIAIKWAISEPDSITAVALLTRWVSTGVEVLAPALLAYELANTLHQRLRKDSITVDEGERILRYVLQEVVQLDSSQNTDLSVRAMRLAYQYALPAAYDAHFLALAEREKCDYWTADTRLWNAIGGKLPWVRRLADYQQMLH